MNNMTQIYYLFGQHKFFFYFYGILDTETSKIIENRKLKMF